METPRIEYFKEHLLEDKRRLDQELHTLGSKDPTQPNRFVVEYPESGGNSDDDNAAEISEYADGLSIEARLEAELRDVNKALSAIENGTYGVCKYCKKDIGEKRLEARPASSSCIECKKLLTQEM